METLEKKLFDMEFNRIIKDQEISISNVEINKQPVFSNRFFRPFQERGTERRFFTYNAWQEYLQNHVKKINYS